MASFITTMFVPLFTALSLPASPLLPTCPHPRPQTPQSPSPSPSSTATTLPQHTLEPACEQKAQSLPLSAHSNARTRNQFKPRATNKGTSSYQLRQFAEATLGSGSLRKAVKLPDGEDLNEWLAVNVVDFYNQINLLYGSITEFCSPQSCPEMKATDEFEYLWQDSENFKRPTKMPAPQYVEHLMGWVQGNIDNEQMFPSRIGVPFPKTFPTLIRQLFKRLYRVYAHIYCHHYPVVVQLGLEPHLNTSFKHYVLFIDEHGLASGKDFWGPLGDLVDSMLRSD
ncbi:MOB kinase activator 1B [Xylographa pallens]|nr:MOB kinase activator 1B [Xylographa pallens]